MKITLRLAATTLVALTLGEVAAHAQLLNGANNQVGQSVYGVIVGMQRGNGVAAIRVRPLNSPMNAGMMGNLFGGNFGAGNNAAGNLVGANQFRGAGRGMSQTFMVGPGTQFVAVRGPGRFPTSFAALRQGQHVTVQAQGGQAALVQILPRQQYGAYYRPRYYQQRGRSARNSSPVLSPSAILQSNPSAQATPGQIASANARQQAKLARVRPGQYRTHGRRR